ncbi:MAG: AAA family ATPase [Proteobacteria bacterium]|jgi:type II secretory pathway predicted ATPase ExeA|nr:AAA family ATPase [Pseudomonadota bacterium]
MYREFYQLREKPFGKTPDPRFLYLSQQHEEALARLRFAVEEREFMVLTGEIGSGKTTLSRALIDSVGPEVKLVLLYNPRLSPTQLLRSLIQSLGGQPRSNRNDLWEELSDLLFELFEAGKQAVLIVDEAQLIPEKATLDELRLITNFQLDDLNLLTLILLGQPELRERLRRPGYRALFQRVGLRYHLGPLNQEETGKYLRHRLRVAGREQELFNPGAVERIYAYSQGLPRLINNLAASALLEGFGREQDQIGPEIVTDIARELELKEE